MGFQTSVSSFVGFAGEAYSSCSNQLCTSQLGQRRTTSLRSSCGAGISISGRPKGKGSSMRSTRRQRLQRGPKLAATPAVASASSQARHETLRRWQPNRETVMPHCGLRPRTPCKKHPTHLSQALLGLLVKPVLLVATNRVPASLGKGAEQACKVLAVPE